MRALGLAVVLASGACHDAKREEVRSMTPMQLSDDLERQLASVRADPVDAVGFGEKDYVPYVLRRGESLTHGDDPAVTARLASAMASPAAPRVERLAILQIIGLRADPTVDATLIDALADPALRPLAAYLLGRPGFKGYPKRTRNAAAVLDALGRHLDDAGTFDDPWYQRTYRTQDLVLAAFVRVAGPERFDLSSLAGPRAEMIGYELAAFDDAGRASLLAQCKALARRPP
jgi:hypothetical protein